MWNWLVDASFRVFGCLGFLLFMGLGLAQLWLGYQGIEFHLGEWVAIGAALLALIVRIMLPMTVGTYFGVVDVVGWPWWAGVLIAAPGIVFAAPFFISVIVEKAFGLIRFKREDI